METGIDEPLFEPRIGWAQKVRRRPPLDDMPGIAVKGAAIVQFPTDLFQEPVHNVGKLIGGASSMTMVPVSLSVAVSFGKSGSN